MKKSLPEIMYEKRTESREHTLLLGTSSKYERLEYFIYNVINNYCLKKIFDNRGMASCLSILLDQSQRNSSQD